MKFGNLLTLIATTGIVSATDYIVCLHDVNPEISGGNQTFKIGDFNGFFLKDSDADIAAILGGMNGVVAVEEDQVATASYGWGLDRVNQVHLPLDSDDSFSCTGSGVDAYILDTGIRTSHVDFEGRAIWGTNTVGDGIDEDCQGPTYHGTHVASTVGGKDYGIAKAVDLIAVKVLGCSGSGSYSGIISGIEWAVTRMGDTGRRSVINMSLGGPAHGGLNAAVAAATSAGMHVVVAAGNNDGDACLKSPASAASAVTVGSTTSSDTRSSFSNWGSCVDLFAPGSNIPAADGKDDTSSHSLSGTSMASPHTAGVVALLLGGSDFTPAAMVTELLSLGSNGKVIDPKGSPNELLYVGVCEDELEEKDLDAPDDNSVIFYYEATGEETEYAENLGYTVVVPSAVDWNLMTTDNYKTYKSIIFADHHCSGDEDNILSGAFANRVVWSPAVLGNMVVHSFDPSWHEKYTTHTGPELFLNTTITFVSEGEDTGLYMSTSCYHFGDDSYVVEILDEFGEITVTPDYHGDEIHIVDNTHLSLIGSTDDTLSNWGSSVHNYFNSFPEDFKVIAIAESGSGELYDGVLGFPVLLVRDTSVEYPDLFYCPSQSYQALEGTVATDSWCQAMCNQPVGYAHCPSDLCECAGEDDIPTEEICESPRVCGSGEYVANPGTTANDDWCNSNCNNEWWVNCPCTLCMCAETSPDPECEGQTCSTFESCNAGGDCGTSGVCTTLEDGGGLCLDGRTSCAGLTPCPNGVSDCDSGDVCVVDTCCGWDGTHGTALCIPDTQFCSNPLKMMFKRVFEESEESEGPSIGHM